MRILEIMIRTTVVILGGLLAVIGGQAAARPPAPDQVVWAQGNPPVAIPAPDPGSSVGTWLGGAGILAVTSALATGFWQDRKDSRAYKLQYAKMTRIASNAEAIRNLYSWAGVTHRSFPDKIPAPPELPNSFDDGSEIDREPTPK